MKKTRFSFAIGALVFFIALSGCGTIKMTPVTEESRLTYPTKDASIYVVVKEGMSFDDKKHPTYRIFLPAGTYKLEARDDDYLYFTTTGVITQYIFDGKTIVEQMNNKGGLMLGRRLGMLVPAGIYKDDGSLNRVMVWKLDSVFMKEEGAKWTLHQGDAQSSAPETPGVAGK